MLTRIGNNVRTALTTMIFKKLTKLSSTSTNQTDIGQVINIMTNDLTRIEDLSFFAGFVVVSPIMCIIVVYFTCEYLNWAACVSGFAMICLFIAFQALMGVLFGRFRQRTTDITDERVNRMSELISAMKILKFYCWEEPFADVVDDIRRREIDALKRSYYLKGINLSFFYVTTRIMIFATFIAYVLMGNSLESEQVFVVMALYDAIRLPVTAFLPQAVGLAAETVVTVSRIQKILLMDEKSISKTDIPDQPKGSITLKKFSAKWTKDSTSENLIDLSLQIKPGDLVVVIGSVGAGKSCFLYALLDEIERTRGICSLAGTLSYAPQESWCFGGNVKQNILLSNAEDRTKFNKVVKVCGLERDLELFPEGERTFVGEKGYSLSGGQKARISLARAVYHDSDVYLLDDPLSAVDPKVANHIFNNCIFNYLRNRKKTVVLVTHQLQFLRKADKVMVLDKGKMIAFGSYSDLLSANFDFLSHLEADVKKMPIRRELSNSVKRKPSFKTVSFSESSLDDSLEDAPDEEPAPRVGDDIDEKRASGKFDTRVYIRYCLASRRPFLLLVSAVFTILAEALYRFNDFWLSAWTQKDMANNTKAALGAGSVVENDIHNVLIYTSLIVILFVVAFLRVYFIFLVCLISSINIHNSVFKTLLRAPIAFYESNSLGEFSPEQAQ
jgi:ATP-binding cassette subfamily C (CFTR/MRP) protein 4